MIPAWTRASDIRTLTLGGGCQGAWTLGHLYDDLPDAIWFILGTSIHYGIEKTCLEEVTTIEGALAVAYAEKERLMREALDAGIIEQNSGKRGIATVDADIERILGKWWADVHPSSPTRMPIYDQYQWPPQVEVVVDVGEGEDRLVTTVDAIFTTLGGDWSVIVDWKTGNSKTASDTQLHTYMFGLGQLGYRVDPRNLGWFHHCEHSKLQPVTGYWGDAVINAQIRATYGTKVDILNRTEAVFNPDWWCGYCTARSVCPVRGEGDWVDIRDRIKQAGFQLEPETGENE